MITEDGRSEKEVVRRIGMVEATFNKMKKVLSNLHMNMAIRLRLLSNAEGSIWQMQKVLSNLNMEMATRLRLLFCVVSFVIRG